MFKKDKTNERPQFLNKAEQLSQVVYNDGLMIDALVKEIQKCNEMLNILRTDSIFWKNAKANKLEVQVKLDAAMRTYDINRQEYKKEIARLKELNPKDVDLEVWEKYLPFDSYNYLKHIGIA